jgi:hypothetical protein
VPFFASDKTVFMSARVSCADSPSNDTCFNVERTFIRVTGMNDVLKFQFPRTPRSADY